MKNAISKSILEIRQLNVLTAIAICAVIFLFLSCCDDCPTCPGPEPEEHLFYIAPITGNMVKILSVEQKKIIDSFLVDSVADSLSMGLHVIGNDSLLAVSAGVKTYIVDLQTKEITGSFDVAGPIFSRDSRYYISLDDRNIYTYPGHSLVFDHADGNLPIFSSDSRYHAIVRWPMPGGVTGTEITIYDIYGDSTFTGLSHVPGIIGWWNYVADKHFKIFFGVTTSAIDLMASADFGADSIRVLKGFPNFYTVYAFPVVAPDQKYLFVASITLEFWGGVPDEYIHVFDAMSEDSVASIAFEGMNQVGNIIITHDSKFLLARPFNEFENKTHVCLIDAVNFKVIGTFDCGFLPKNIAAKYGAKNLEV